MEDIWESFTVIKNKKVAQENKLRAKRKGETTSKKKIGNCETLVKNKKLDESTDADKHKKVTKEQGKCIQEARIKKGWNQKKLANELNMKLDVIKAYESGTAILNNQILNQIKRKLNIK